MLEFFIVKPRAADEIFNSLEDRTFPNLSLAYMSLWERIATNALPVDYASKHRIYHIYHIQVTDNNQLTQNFKSPTKVTGYQIVAEIDVDPNPAVI